MLNGELLINPQDSAINNVKLLITQDMELGCIRVVQATNRKALIDVCNQHMRGRTIPEDGIYLHLELSGEQLGCEGGFVDYRTEEDVPTHSVPCPCGNPKHWLIKYDQET